MMDRREYAALLADRAEQIDLTLKAMNLDTSIREDRSLPAPELHRALCRLATASYRLRELVLALSDAMAHSPAEDDLCNPDGTDPAGSVAASRRHLTDAAQYGLDFAARVSLAHGAINRTEHRTDTDPKGQ